ncbi:hypothetical protein SGFS_099380 [Streptomyces graminofaciens]|uniref:GAF domain-containing protein n=1 Tax=Streptomyces graminofaciens TaxID=68212 RepID=A0ABN5VYV9_9ACTN|nr:hypothetical protein SGFS_099380 [Streptomyces graminofaciens]
MWCRPTLRGGPSGRPAIRAGWLPGLSSRHQGKAHISRGVGACSLTGHWTALRHDIAGSDVPPWLAASPDRRRALRIFGIHSVLLVPLWARGTPLGLVQFLRHRTAVPFDDEDLLLAHEIASRAAVYTDNARRYAHERSTALTLQRSLLQHQVPEQSAVETACRYLPCGSRAGVGGDWYDVIPLSGARVALATMGRLRTAVRTLADIDLMPDELLTHLDDVVIRMQREQERGADETSATCLYAVYDPVSRLCSLAHRRPHPKPRSRRGHRTHAAAQRPCPSTRFVGGDLRGPAVRAAARPPHR